MDCVFVQTRVAAFVDGELAPAEEEQFALHIERCEVCAEVVLRIEGQEFVPLTALERESVCGGQEFWASMEQGLCDELDQLASVTGQARSPWYGRRVGLPIPVAVLYAAAMLLAVGWGMQQQDRAEAAEGSAEHLGRQLEQERRTVAQPAPPASQRESGSYKVVTYTPQSGTF